MTVSCCGTARTESCARNHRERSCLQDPAFGSQLLYIHILPNSASISPLDSHTSQKSHIYIKTTGFKSFRHTYLHSAISQSLLNHILTKNRVGGGGPPRVRTRITNHQSRVTGRRQLSTANWLGSPLPHQPPLPLLPPMPYNLPHSTGAKENHR
jgi:hypothetical protein